MNNFKCGVISLATVIMLGCASVPQGKFSPDKSFLNQSKSVQVKTNGNIDTASNKNNEHIVDTSEMTYLQPMSSTKSNQIKPIDLTMQFSNDEMVKLTVDALPLKDYLHYVLGELLNVSYILGDKVQADNKTVTLNLQQDISKRKLFNISEDILTERKYVIRFDDGIYYIHELEGAGASGQVVYGYGNHASNVPTSSLEIIQMVPFDFGLKSQLSLVITSIAKVTATVSSEHNAFIIRGKRNEVIKALEFIDLVDQPGFKNRHIGIFKTKFVSVEDVSLKLAELLSQEGLTVSTGAQINKAISIVTLERTGSLIFFASSEKILQRIEFWSKQIDQAPSGNETQYIVYKPEYSRASDLGESLQALIGQATSNLTSSTSAAAQNSKTNSAAQKTTLSASNEDMKLVVDERSNSLIFFTSGDKYRQIYPLIKRLDVMPKQVILEVMIAEVTMTDEFKQGVEFAFANGNYGFSTKGAFMGEGFGGLSYLLKGTNGELAINLLQTNSLVNILSKPYIVVRDGVNAEISVGTDIPIIGETSNDPINGDKQTTKIDYRKTGVDLSVTPTVNAQGLISMEINQSISNEVEAGSTVAGSPSVFERTLKTEVLAESGQTIILGGLISENSSKKDSRVPFFSSIPILGGLFGANTESGDKTELVILVTPRVIESNNEWHDIKNKLTAGFNKLNINQ